MSLKSKLQDWRKRRGFSVSDLSDEAGVSRKVIADAETFKKIPTPSDQGRLAIALRVAISYLFPSVERARYKAR